MPTPSQPPLTLAPGPGSMSLFEDTRRLERLAFPDADIRIMHGFLAPAQAQACFDLLHANTPWNQPTVRVWGREHLQPRLSCWHGDADAVYRFSGTSFQPHPWTAALQGLREAVEAMAETRFNSVLLNLYRDEHDSIAMHSDDEPELGDMPVIASLSLGEMRLFRLAHRHGRAAPVSLALTNGSLLIMAGRTQACWKHGVRKERHGLGPRINLTFRHIRRP